MEIGVNGNGKIRVIFQGSQTLAGFDQNRTGSDRPGCFQVTVGITHGMNGVQPNRIVPGQLVKQARLRFTTVAAVIRAVGTEKNGGDITARLPHCGKHFGMNRIKRGLTEQPPGYTGLIGQHGYLHTTLIETRNGLNTAGYGNPFIRRLDVSVGIFIDNPIPIQHNER
jgi:hypothetical protein